MMSSRQRSVPAPPSPGRQPRRSMADTPVYFTDLDGHAWEIAHNPGFPLAEDGSISIPDFSEA